MMMKVTWQKSPDFFLSYITDEKLKTHRCYVPAHDIMSLVNNLSEWSKASSALQSLNYQMNLFPSFKQTVEVGT